VETAADTSILFVSVPLKDLMTKAQRPSLYRQALALPAKLMARALVFLIQAYRIAISPLLGAHCRYQPTCSAYAIEALERHGLIAGSALALKRLLRCHPIKWLGGNHGFDPVPEPDKRVTRTSNV
jgi:putative membrane protein insertion efficiency factor